MKKENYLNHHIEYDFNNKIKCQNLQMKLFLLLLSKNLMKLLEVVKEGARDVRMVGFHFNTSCLFFFFHIHLHLRCLWPEGLFHSFLLCEKFTFNFATFFVKHLEELYQQVVILLLYYAIGE